MDNLKKFTIIFIFSLFLFIFIEQEYFTILYAEEIITIIPGSSDEKRERFYDITYYPIKPGKIIKWSNADNTPHEIEILSQNNVTIKNYKINPKDTFSFKFEKIGKYTFQSSHYHWMKGIVDITNNLKTKKTELKDIDVEITWSPSKPRNEITHFKIIFIDKNKKNIEHVDYIFAIKDKIGNLIAQNIPIHSGWGMEMTQFKIDHLKNLVLELTITGLSFQPIDPQKVKVVFE